MDAIAIVFDLMYCGIISHGDQKTITQNVDDKLQNQILHAQLMKKCTTKALMDVCDKITAVEGNPKMKKLGDDMKKELEKGVICCIRNWQLAVRGESLHLQAQLYPLTLGPVLGDLDHCNRILCMFHSQA